MRLRPAVSSANAVQGAPLTKWLQTAGVVAGAAASVLSAAIMFAGALLVHLVRVPFITVGAMRREQETQTDPPLEASRASAAVQTVASADDVTLSPETVHVASATAAPPQSTQAPKIDLCVADIRAITGEAWKNAAKLAAVDGYLAERLPAPSEAPRLSVEQCYQYREMRDLLDASGHLSSLERGLVTEALYGIVQQLGEQRGDILELLLMAPGSDVLDGSVLRLLQGYEGDASTSHALYELATIVRTLPEPSTWRAAWTTLLAMSTAERRAFAAEMRDIDERIRTFMESQAADKFCDELLRQSIYRVIADQIGNGAVVFDRDAMVAALLRDVHDEQVSPRLLSRNELAFLVD